MVVAVGGEATNSTYDPSKGDRTIMAALKSRSASINELGDYVMRLSKGDAESGAVVAECYAAELKDAHKKQLHWRRLNYWSSGLVIVASAIITALTGINLHGEAAFALRLSILMLSALVTILTGLIELVQVNHRWRIYRQLDNRLETLGWQTATRGDAEAASALSHLGTGLISAMREFNRHYMSEVAGADQGKAENGIDEVGEQSKPDTLGGGKATIRPAISRRRRK